MRKEDMRTKAMWVLANSDDRRDSCTTSIGRDYIRKVGYVSVYARDEHTTPDILLDDASVPARDTLC